MFGAEAVAPILRWLFHLPLLRPIVRPLTRFLVGALAIPLFRLFLKKVVRLQELNEELEKDLEQWFRGALVLLVATKNMESTMFDWFLNLGDGGAWPEPVLFALRLSLAIGVIEFMPDQELFSIIHGNPPSIDYKKGLWRELRAKWKPLITGVLGQQVNRYAPVFAIVAVAFDGTVGWVGYVTAIVLYLFIGLVTSKDKALDVLSEFDRQIAQRRRELMKEFDGEDRPAEPPSAGAEPVRNAAPEPGSEAKSEAESARLPDVTPDAAQPAEGTAIFAGSERPGTSDAKSRSRQAAQREERIEDGQ